LVSAKVVEDVKTKMAMDKSVVRIISFPLILSPVER